MREKVVVDGIVLTRAQVESAYKELQKPEFKAGDIVKFKDCYYHSEAQVESMVVTSPTTNVVLYKHYNSDCMDRDRQIFTVGLKTGELFLSYISALELVPDIYV